MNEIPIIRSAKLSEYPPVLFGLSTRMGGVSPEPFGLNLSFDVGDEWWRVVENRRRFFEGLRIGLDELAIPQQCHSKRVRKVFFPGGYENCDALVTSERGVFLAVSVADCLPMFIYDPKQNVVAALHIGWRGCVGGIVEEATEFLEREFSSRPEDFVIFLGPSARSCCYEIGEDVARKYDEQFLHPKSAGKFFLDLPETLKHRLRGKGVQEDRIEDDGRCTICSPELFHSYRRDGERSGRMMGVIGLLR